jgi:hypothetical protein
MKRIDSKDSSERSKDSRERMSRRRPGGDYARVATTDDRAVQERGRRVRI